MPARLFLALLAARRRASRLLLPAAAVFTVVSLAADLGGWLPPPWLLVGLPLVALLGAVEPVLVVLGAAEVGALWAGADPWSFGAAVGVGAITALVRLQDHRGRSSNAVAALGTLALAGVLACAVGQGPLILLPAAAALILVPLGMDALLPRRATGTPALFQAIGGVWVFVYVMVLQFGLLIVLRKLLRVSDPRVRAAGRAGMRWLFKSFPYGRFDRSGVDAAAFAKPAIVVANHQSSVDIPIVLGLPGDVRLTMRERVWNAPWLGYSARAFGHLRVDDQLLERCREVLDEGACVHFFPEGTRSRDGYPARFHRGAFELATQLGCDVIPVVLVDTRTAVPRDGYWVECHHMSLKVLDRVPAGEDSRALCKRVQGIVRAEFERELARLNTPTALRRKIRRLYRYQGWRVAWAVRRELRELSEIPAEPAGEETLLEDCGYGVAAHWLAECFPRRKIRATDADPAKLAVAERSAENKPRLTFILCRGKN